MMHLSCWWCINLLYVVITSLNISLINADYLNEWLLEVPGGLHEAKQIGDQYGFDVKQFSDNFPDVFIFRHGSVPKRARRSARAHNTFLGNDTRILWSQQQAARTRQKRDYVHREVDTSYLLTGTTVIHPDLLTLGTVHDGKERTVNTITPQLPDASVFNDPMWSKQWYLLGDLETNGREMRSMGSLDQKQKPISLNVFPAWQAGFTGLNVVVTILDDGVEGNHSDLVHNFDPEASIDINDSDRDPTPRYDNPEETHHGTRCAGEVAMQANNDICGVGIAYNARIGGIRMLDGTVTDRVEAEAFSFNNNYIHIYSSSWGPSDDGRTVEGPGLMASRAFEKGVMEGRQGRGVIYVWASGNGGINGDSCAYDGYASNIFTLSIGSATEHGHFPIYGEICASTMAVTYSSGSLREGKIVSADILNTCTTEHTGTSASAPLAAGMIALALEANPNLTWRDMKHVVAWSADPFPLLSSPGWNVNGAGLLISPAFGFGLMDADKLVKAASVWVTAPPKVKCVVRKAGIEESVFTILRPLRIPVLTHACQNTGNEINHLEHVELIVSLSHLKRGAVRIFLESPMGTRTLVAPRRDADFSSDGLNGWSFISVHNWGENPAGVWTVLIESHLNQSFGIGSLHSLRLVFHGTKVEPPSTNILRTWRLENMPKMSTAHPELALQPPAAALIPGLKEGVSAKTSGSSDEQGGNTTVSPFNLVDWFRNMG